MYQNDKQLRAYKYFGAILNIPPEIDDVYMKCRRIIHSCFNLKQLSVAKRYIDLWKNKLPQQYQYLYVRVLSLYLKKEQHFLSLRKINVK